MQAGPKQTNRKRCRECKKCLTSRNKVKDNYTKSGYKGICRSCNCLRARRWRNENPEHVKAKAAEWIRENKEYIKNSQLAKLGKVPESFAFRGKSNGRTREEARAHSKEYKRAYDKRNKEKIDNYRNENRDKINKQQRERNRVRRKEEPSFRLREMIRRQFAFWVKSKGIKRGEEYTKIIGCSFEELCFWLEKHFEEGMTWNNYGKYEPNRKTWHIDHHYPLSKFDLSNPEHLKCAFHYTNLYPMWGVDNMSKGSEIPEAPRNNIFIPDFVTKVEFKVKS